MKDKQYNEIELSGPVTGVWVPGNAVAAKSTILILRSQATTGQHLHMIRELSNFSAIYIL